MSSVKSKKGFIFIITVAFLITGNLIGAGILGLPVNTGLDGFFPSLLVMLIFGGAMFFTAVVLGGEAAESRKESFNYPSLYHRYLGSWGKWIAVMANMLILYGLLTAYLAGGATIICQLFNFTHGAWIILIVLFSILTGLTVLGTSVIRKYNALLMILLWGSFAVIVFIAEEHVESKRLFMVDWQFIPMSIPIIVTSFHFHNIIPNITESLDWDMKALWKAMLAGMIIGYLMNATWIMVGVGVLPYAGGDESLLYAFKHNLPATVPMAEAIKSSTFTTCSMLFALLAITTSYIANGLGLMGFNQDLTENFFKKSSKLLVITVTFLPPLIIGLLFPDIFLKAINLVGGVGIVLLFGILPSIICYLKAKGKKAVRTLAVLMFFLFLLVFLFQVAEECGVVNIQPKPEDIKDVKQEKIVKHETPVKEQKSIDRETKK
jgi:tyrosine-specific transport protein